MTTDSQVSDAIQDLLDCIDDDDDEKAPREPFVELVASDYDLNPLLLKRKFQERFGQTVAAYVPGPKVDLAKKREEALQKAIDKAHKEASFYEIPSTSKGWVGKVFKFEGKDYAFVVIGGSTYPIKAVRVEDCQFMGFNKPCWPRIHDQLTKDEA